LLPKVFPKLDRLGKVLLATFFIMLTVELAQLFTLLGSCDTDDLILNVLGSAMGYGIQKRLS
jgi:glycopeptide antibiotics resistance protein